jgi:hypothetical protein
MLSEISISIACFLSSGIWRQGRDLQVEGELLEKGKGIRGREDREGSGRCI